MATQNIEGVITLEELMVSTFHPNHGGQAGKALIEKGVNHCLSLWGSSKQSRLRGKTITTRESIIAPDGTGGFYEGYQIFYGGFTRAHS